MHLDDGSVLRSTLGGAGLAISKYTHEPTAAAAYAKLVASESIQCGIYFESGGQPGFRKAWTNETVNQRSGAFFAKTLETLDAAYLRPRFDGYLTFQDEASEVLSGAFHTRIARTPSRTGPSPYVCSSRMYW